MRKAISIALILLLTGCPLIAPKKGEDISFTTPILVWSQQYVLSAQGDWCPWKVGTKSCKVHPPGDYIVSEGVGPLLLVTPRDFISTQSTQVPYDPQTDLCLTHPVPGFSCSPNYVLSSNVQPNDNLYSQLWGLKRPRFPKLWNHADCSGVLVAIIDSGLNHHPDIENRVLWTKAFNAINGTGDVSDGNGHGTHVAGTIGASWNDGGVAGVCSSGKLVPIKFLSDSGSGSLFNAVKAIQYATDNGIKIANNSWGGGGFSQPLFDAIRRFTEGGGLFIAASGNDGANNDKDPHYPSSYDLPGVLAVGAIGPDGALASFSNYGKKSVDIAAPGVGILSTWKDGGYIALSGTSMATPHVSGLAALIASQFPQANAASIKRRILRRAFKREGLMKKISKGRELKAIAAVDP